MDCDHQNTVPSGIQRGLRSIERETGTCPTCGAKMERAIGGVWEPLVVED